MQVKRRSRQSRIVARFRRVQLENSGSIDRKVLVCPSSRRPWQPSIRMGRHLIRFLRRFAWKRYGKHPLFSLGHLLVVYMRMLEAKRQETCTAKTPMSNNYCRQGRCGPNRKSWGLFWVASVWTASIQSSDRLMADATSGFGKSSY